MIFFLLIKKLLYKSLLNLYFVKYFRELSPEQNVWKLQRHLRLADDVQISLRRQLRLSTVSRQFFSKSARKLHQAVAERLQERSRAAVWNLPWHLAGFEGGELQLFFQSGSRQVQGLEAAAAEVEQNRVSFLIKTAVAHFFLSLRKSLLFKLQLTKILNTCKWIIVLKKRL